MKNENNSRPREIITDLMTIAGKDGGGGSGGGWGREERIERRARREREGEPEALNQSGRRRN